jgi:glycosyltransferase involved in cell wall biosynthesis
LFRQHGVSVVHTHNPQPLVFGAPAGKLAGALVVHTKHGANPGRLRQRALRRAAAACVDAYVAVSPTTAALARQHRECARQRLRVVTNGVDTSRFAPNEQARRAVREELGIPEQSSVIGHVGRLAPEKDHALMMRAASPLLNEACHLVIVGDGPLRDSLHALRSELPSRRSIHLPGARGDVERLLCAFDVFVMTSKTEGLPLVIPEAMAAGLPIVSTAVGGIPDVVEHHHTGLLVNSNDELEIRHKLELLLSIPEARHKMGLSARKVAVECYSRERMVDDYLRLYESLAGARELPQPKPRVSCTALSSSSIRP